MLDQYYRINEAIGISVIIQPDGGTIINGCDILIDKNKLQFVKKKTGLKDIAELTQYFSSNVPVALNLSGRGVLIKQIEKIETVSQQDFSKLLPNANLSDFYLQNFISGTSSFISLVRKTEAEKWLDAFTRLGVQIMLFSLGPFPVQNIVSQLNIYEADIEFDGVKVERNEAGDWLRSNFNRAYKSQFPFKVESEPLDERLLISYSSAFQLVLEGRVDNISADIPSVLTTFQKKIDNIRFRTNGCIVLITAFLLLMINFFIFSGLTSANDSLANRASSFSQSSDDLRKLNEKITADEALLTDLGWEEHIDKSVLIDQVASLMPNEVSLQKIEIDPLDMAGKKSQANSVFTNRILEITGVSEKIIPVNEWIERMKTKSWIKNIQLKNYVFSTDLNTGRFIIKINY